MKYMIGLNASFGLASAFVNSFVSGVVVPMALHDTIDTRYVGLFVAFHAGVAATMSLVLGQLSQRVGKSAAIFLGTACLASVALPFLLQPTISNYTWPWLLLLYALQGTGRAMFEGPLKAIFADYFSYEKEGAYANIILQNGLSTALAYMLTFTLTCLHPSAYCISYSEYHPDGGSGPFHDIGTLSLLVVMTSVVAVLGFARATVLYQREVESGDGKMLVYRSASVVSYRNSHRHDDDDADGSSNPQQQPQNNKLVDRTTYAMLEQIILEEDQHEGKSTFELAYRY
jgi:MFS family permease